MDKIRIRNLEVFAHHGVFEEEKKNGQTFIVDLVFFVNTRKAGQTDMLEDSVDYGEVCHFINETMKKDTFDLIETVAENLAKELLLKFNKINEVELEIKKPLAPIGLPFEYVSVKINRKWHEVYIGLGSNMGDKRKHLEDALVSLNNEECCKVEKVSKFIETKPYGNVKQEDYLNGCILLKTLYLPQVLLAVLNNIEECQGRVRKNKWDSRPLDLDILFYDDLVYSDATLRIPHYDLQNRDFVLGPLSEIAPFHQHPLTHKTVEEMWKELKMRG